MLAEKKIYHKVKIDKKTWLPYFVWQDGSTIRFTWNPNFIAKTCKDMYWEVEINEKYVKSSRSF